MFMLPFSIFIKNLLFSLGLGWAVSLLVPNTGEVYAQLTLPPFSPPAWLFGVAWSILYALLGYAAARISASPHSRERTSAYRLYIIHMLLNFCWTPIFFLAQQYTIALILLGILLVSAVWVMALFVRVDKLAACLIIPYLFWLTFAFYLNFGIVVLNR